MVHLPHRNHKNSIWKWSDFHLKKWLSPKKTEKVDKNRKNLTFEKKNKKPSRGIALRNMCTKFGADWNIFTYRNGDTTESLTESQNDQITDT